jgi:hypothetical protein
MDYAPQDDDGVGLNARIVFPPRWTASTESCNHLPCGGAGTIPCKSKARVMVSA